MINEVNTKEEMNENLKIRMKGKEKNQNNKADYKKKTRKLWKLIVIVGNYFIISRSQFLNTNFKSGSRIPALSNVEFIVTGASITMFFNRGFTQSDLFFLFLTGSSSPSNLTAIATNIIVSLLSIFSNMI